jgi:hypothetical protein
LRPPVATAAVTAKAGVTNPDVTQTNSRKFRLGIQGQRERIDQEFDAATQMHKVMLFQHPAEAILSTISRPPGLSSA